MRYLPNLRLRRPARRALAAAAVALSLVTAASAARAEVELGTEAPDVEAKEYVNTEPVKLADLSGRLILLELWKTT